MLLDKVDSVVSSRVLSYEAILDDFGETEDLSNNEYSEVQDTTTGRFQIVSSWIDKAIGDLLDLADLPDNWDSYGSQRIPNELIDVSKIFLSNLEYENLTPPVVVPISGGGIQFEWRKDNRELEIELVDTRNITYLRIVDTKPFDEDSLNIENSQASRRLIRWLNSG